MSNDLLRWLESPSVTTGMRFLTEAKSWAETTYQDLARGAFSFQKQLADAGVRRNDVVCTLLPTGPDVVGALFGTWLAGATVSLLAPPMIFEDEVEYVEHISRVIAVAQPRAMIASPELARFLRQAELRAALSEVPIVEPAGASARSCGVVGVSDCALLQFTSGSSGHPRGVGLSFENLLHNIEAIRGWIGMGPNDVSGIWLPLYHDMGLIGCLLTPTVNQSDVWAMRPDQFVRYPEEWLALYGRGIAHLSASPNFGYGFVARRVTPEQLEGYDFSQWRVAIAGAEPIDAGALSAFASLLKPFGFRESAFMPAYGMAEATLAVTGAFLEDVPRVVLPEWDKLRFGESVPIRATARLDDGGNDWASGWLVSSGQPHSGTEVKVVDEEGHPLPEGVFGEIVVRGPSVVAGYRGPAPDSGTRFEDGWLFSGDAGFFLDGELFVVGRIAESLKLHGRSVYAEDVEARLAAATGLGKGRCVAITTAGHRRGLLIVAEQCDREWAQSALEFLRSVVGDELRFEIVGGAKGVIRRTSSGKPRRRLMWQLHQSGVLEVEPLAHSG